MKILVLSDQRIRLTDSEAKAVQQAMLSLKPVHIPRLEMTISAYEMKRLEPYCIREELFGILGSWGVYYFQDGRLRVDNDLYFNPDEVETERLKKKLIPVDQWLTENTPNKLKGLKLIEEKKTKLHW